MTPGQVFAARFEILEQAGQGGMGVVYRARDHQTGGLVALKILTGPEGDLDRFAREARALAALNHPGIVGYIADGAEGGTRYLAMEWLEGEDLNHLLERQQLSVPDVIALGVALTAPLEAAHAQGLVHRDLKPQNIFLVGSDLSRARLLDFGVARFTAEARGPVTRTGIVVGTPGYMSPEQARGAKNIDARADLYSLGCVLFECLTGRPAFVGESLMAVLAKVLLDEPPRPSDVVPQVPAALDALVLRLMSKSADQRPATAGEVRRALLTITGSTPAAGPRPRLTHDEQRLVCVIAAAPRLSHDWSARTPTPSESLVADQTLRGIADSYGARAELLIDGSFIAVLASDTAASDQVTHAARCALALRTQFPGIPAVLCTGRGVVAGRLPLGDAVDRAAAMLAELASFPQPGVWTDPLTVGLLDARFGTRIENKHHVLLGAASGEDEARPLLGRETPFVGRDRELQVLEAAYLQVAEDSMAQAALITAPAGFGKSRLRHELVKRLRARAEPPTIWLARADQMRAGSPLYLLSAALRRGAGLMDGEAPEVRAQKLLARVAQTVPRADAGRVAAFLGELCEAPFPDADDAPLRAARRDAALMADQVRRAFEEFLFHETSRAPVVLLLEDLHWGDAPTVRLVDGALRHLKGRPFFVCAFARPEVTETFPRLWEERSLQLIRLAELSTRASERLARMMLGAEVDAAVVARVAERAGGNAFYLEELIRQVADGSPSVELPVTVVAMAQRRLESLDAESRAALRAASIFGEVFWESAVRALSPSPSLQELISGLVDREVLTERPNPRFQGEREFAFRHAYLHGAAYQMLTKADRETGHQLAAQWLEQAGEKDALPLAEHYERGGAFELAARWYRTAAEQANQIGDQAAALECVARGLKCGATGEVRDGLELSRIEAKRWAANFQSQLPDALAVLGRLPEGSPAWWRAASLAALAAGIGDDGQALNGLAPRMLDAEAQGESVVPATIARCRLASQLSITCSGDPVPLIAAARRDAGQVPATDPALAAWLHEADAFEAAGREDAGSALTGFRRAAEAFAASGDRRNALAQRQNAAFVLTVYGQLELAEQELAELVEEGARLGLTGFTMATRGLRVLVLESLGKSAAAVEEFKLIVLPSMSSRHGLVPRVMAIPSLVRVGKVAEAEALARECAGMEAKLQHGIDARPSLAMVLLHLGRPAEALEVLGDAAHSRSLTLTGMQTRPHAWWLQRARALSQLGRQPEARVALREALGLLRQSVAAVADETLRRGLLERDRVATEIIALAREWQSG